MIHPLPSAVTSRRVATARLETNVYQAGAPTGEPVLFVHGNVSSARFWDGTLTALPGGYFGFAPDLRGYGDTEPKPIDATRGVRDFSDDLRALVESLGLAGRKVHVVGWSVGGAVAMQYAIDHPGSVASVTLVAPMSPFGFGGTRDLAGTATTPDWAGTGGGTANGELVANLKAGDASEASPFTARSVMRKFYFKEPFSLPRDREDTYTAEMLKMRIGDDFYPGDLVAVPSWPGVAPGTRGMNNAISGKYCDVSAFADITPRPDVLWIRGTDDAIVGDHSVFDLGFLGQLGVVPGWPGAEVYPPQPMVSQMRAVLDKYAANGGRYEEKVLPDCGHSPPVEKPADFNASIFGFIAARSLAGARAIR
ncbi:MAG: alpha/beta hydrolase [Polyangiaceae bacterium]